MWKINKILMFWYVQELRITSYLNKFDQVREDSEDLHI